MDTYEEIYKTICRVCLSYENTQNMISLTDNNTQDGLSCHGKAVLTFANITLEQSYLPVAMCRKCLYYLKQATYFKLLCESSDKCLKKLVEIVGNSIEKVKEKIVEYTMFKFYFPDSLNTSKENRISVNERKNNVQDKLNLIHKNSEVFEESTKNLENYDSLTIHSETEPSTDCADETLNKMQILVNSNLTTEIIPKLSRKRLKLKKKLAKRKRILALKNMNKQRRSGKNLICSICNKVLANQLTYEHHMQRHNGCRYICEHCGKGFPVRTELKIHQVSRHGTGPYLQCSHCPFKAPRKFDLTEHERLHSGERPYTCEKCGLTFRRRGIWRKHLIYHTEKKIQCPQCPRKFFQRSEMLAHANNIHDRVYVYLCNKCGATYAKTATVRRHMTERHGIPREMQGKIIRVNKGVGYQEP